LATGASIGVIACGALAREIVHLLRGNGWHHVAVECLPAELHNRPERIPEAVRRKIHDCRERYPRLFVAYADCGTGGLLDRVLEEEGVQRLPGAHCYEFFAGRAAFAQIADQEPGTLYLTDFLARHFQRFIIEGLGIDRHPELLPVYFGNYRRLVYLSQTGDEELVVRAQGAAQRLGLDFEHRHTGYGELATTLAVVVGTDGRNGAPSVPAGVAEEHG